MNNIHLRIVSIVIAIATITGLSDSVDYYCNLGTCPPGTTHTMCLYPSPDPSPACGEVSWRGLTSEQIQIIVDKHNELRRTVANGQETRGSRGPQPAAVSMPDMAWDNELAGIAQRWADQCDSNHDKCRTVERFSVGQNIATGSSTGQLEYDVAKLVEIWYDEVTDFDHNAVPNFSSITNFYYVGHYTQVVWAETTLVGCGLVVYKAVSKDEVLLVCNYGPSGNVPNQPVYEARGW